MTNYAALAVLVVGAILELIAVYSLLIAHSGSPGTTLGLFFVGATLAVGGGIYLDWGD